MDYDLGFCLVWVPELWDEVFLALTIFGKLDVGDKLYLHEGDFLLGELTTEAEGRRRRREYRLEILLFYDSIVERKFFPTEWRRAPRPRSLGVQLKGGGNHVGGTPTLLEKASCESFFCEMRNVSRRQQGTEGRQRQPTGEFRPEQRLSLGSARRARPLF